MRLCIGSTILNVSRNSFRSTKPSLFISISRQISSSWSWVIGFGMCSLIRLHASENSSKVMKPKKILFMYYYTLSIETATKPIKTNYRRSLLKAKPREEKTVIENTKVLFCVTDGSECSTWIILINNPENCFQAASVSVERFHDVIRISSILQKHLYIIRLCRFFLILRFTQLIKATISLYKTILTLWHRIIKWLIPYIFNKRFNKTVSLNLIHTPTQVIRNKFDQQCFLLPLTLLKPTNTLTPKV